MSEQPNKKRGRPPKVRTDTDTQVSISDPLDAPDDPPISTNQDELQALVDSIADDDLAGLYQEAVQRIRDGIRGFWTVYAVKKAKLLRGESEWELETPSGIIYGYKRLPDTSLLKLVTEQTRGKAGTKETTVKATTLVLKLAVPGHDADVDKYLASLDQATLDKYDFPPDVLERISKYRE
jgi:hypothetical protein